MGIKSSTIAAPIKNFVKYFSHENSPLDEKFSKDAYQQAEPQTKLDLISQLKVIKKEKKRVSGTWGTYLFRIECIRSAVVLGFLIASYKDRELSHVLKGKMVLVVGPHMRVSIRLVPFIEIGRHIAKFVSVYHKKQLSSVRSRLNAYADIDHHALLKTASTKA